MLDTIRIEDAVTSDMEGVKVITSHSYAGVFDYRMRRFFVSSVIFSRHPLSGRTRLLRINTRKFNVSLYNYCSGFSTHRTEKVYGVHVLFLRLVWYKW